MRAGLLETARARLAELEAEYPDAVHTVSVSGGKDSTATYLLAMELLGDRFNPVMADTGHELPPVYEYVRDLPIQTGGPAVKTVRADFRHEFPKRRENVWAKWAKEQVPRYIIDRARRNLNPSGNPYLDMCLLKGGFPSPTQQFCTHQLKILPIIEQHYQQMPAGRPVISWTGVRKDESSVRSHYLDTGPLIVGREAQRLHGGTVKGVVFRPLLDWNIQDVWAWHKAKGVRPNPLYSLNLARVGCGPCIYARLGEIRLLMKHFPAFLETLEDWERRVGLVCKQDPPVGTFFAAKDLRRFYGDDITTETHGIRAMVEYAMSRRPRASETPGGLFPPEVEIFGECGLVGMCE